VGTNLDSEPFINNLALSSHILTQGNSITGKPRFASFLPDQSIVEPFGPTAGFLLFSFTHG
jgi:hypothetical protein